MPGQNILVINAGSSSIKFALYADKHPLGIKLCSGQIANIGAAAKFRYALQSGENDERLWPDVDDHSGAFAALLTWLLAQFDRDAVAAVGHRVVHGGSRFYQPVIIDTQVMDYLQSIVPLAPLHQPHNISGVQSMQK